MKDYETTITVPKSLASELDDYLATEGVDFVLSDYNEFTFYEQSGFVLATKWLSKRKK